MAIPAEKFMAAAVVERAAILLAHAFREPVASINPVDVAMAIENEQSGGGIGVLGGNRNPGPETLRRVSEAWQVLVRAGLICPDLAQSAGVWWLLTDRGRQARDSSDTEGEIQLALDSP